MATGRNFVVAIDFGTTYSGYAFSTRGNKEKIFSCSWTHGITQTTKTPTNILFTPTKDFHSFGYEAEEKYSSLSQTGEHKDWYYFKRFKLTLYKNQNLNERTTIKEITGKELPAIDVFSHGIGYLKNHLFSHFKERIPQLREDDIQWVLTIPAIWDETAKKFMRKAAERTGIPGTRLTLALEPESAALFCQSGISRCGLNPVKPGDRFLLLDCGGGTVDVTAHEVRYDKSLKEIHRASGGPWGGIKVDDAFEEYLLDCFGFETIAQLSKSEVVELQKNFESFKKKVDNENKVRYMQIPLTLLKNAPSNLLVAGKFKLEHSVVKGFFNESVQHICGHIEHLMSTQELRGIRTIILVGGLSESDIVRKAIEDKFPTLHVVRPSEPATSVVKGAVDFGHCPEKIMFRKSPYTYGVGTITPFVHRVHPQSKMIVVDGKEFCEDHFSVHIQKDKLVQTGTPISDRNYWPAYSYQTVLPIEVHTSDSVNPSFTTDPGCRKIGSFDVELPDSASGVERSVNVKTIFSGTEIHIEARNRYTMEPCTYIQQYSNLNRGHVFFYNYGIAISEIQRGHISFTFNKQTIKF